jgi:hypothetical protein
MSRWLTCRWGLTKPSVQRTVMRIPPWTALDGRELRLRSQLTAAARGLAGCPLGVGDLSRPWRNQGHESRSDESGENDDSSRHIA